MADLRIVSAEQLHREADAPELPAPSSASLSESLQNLLEATRNLKMVDMVDGNALYKEFAFIVAKHKLPPEPEIEITPAMLAAGRLEVTGFELQDAWDSPRARDDLLIMVFRAMLRAR